MAVSRSRRLPLEGPPPRGGPCWKPWLVLRELLVMIRFLPLAARASASIVALGVALMVGGLGAGCRKKSDPGAASDPRATAAVAGGANNAPKQSAEELKAPLARIDNVTITLGELQERINRQSPYIRAR